MPGAGPSSDLGAPPAQRVLQTAPSMRASQPPLIDVDHDSRAPSGLSRSPRTGSYKLRDELRRASTGTYSAPPSHEAFASLTPTQTEKLLNRRGTSDDISSRSRELLTQQQSRDGRLPSSPEVVLHQHQMGGDRGPPPLDPRAPPAAKIPSSSSSENIRGSLRLEDRVAGAGEGVKRIDERGLPSTLEVLATSPNDGNKEQRVLAPTELSPRLIGAAGSRGGAGGQPDPLRAPVSTPAGAVAGAPRGGIMEKRELRPTTATSYSPRGRQIVGAPSSGPTGGEATALAEQDIRASAATRQSFSSSSSSMIHGGSTSSYVAAVPSTRASIGGAESSAVLSAGMVGKAASGPPGAMVSADRRASTPAGAAVPLPSASSAATAFSSAPTTTSSGGHRPPPSDPGPLRTGEDRKDPSSQLAGGVVLQEGSSLPPLPGDQNVVPGTLPSSQSQTVPSASQSNIGGAAPAAPGATPSAPLLSVKSSSSSATPSAPTLGQGPSKPRVLKVVMWSG